MLRVPVSNANVAVVGANSSYVNFQVVSSDPYDISMCGVTNRRAVLL